MSILSVIISIVATSIQGVFKKQLNVKCENCEFSVSVLTTAFAFVFFLLFARNLVIPDETAEYEWPEGMEPEEDENRIRLSERIKIKEGL